MRGRVLARTWGWAIAGYMLGDVFCAGAGMGVPVFNIIFGSAVGWYTAEKVIRGGPMGQSLGKLLVISALTSLLTVLIMAVIWLPALKLLSGPAEKLANFGIPQLLYTPRASFIAWIILMVIVSPFLQFLVSVAAGNVALARRHPGR